LGNSKMGKNRYKAIVSSDWNECLAPCGPFDYISFVYPELNATLTRVFQQYTGNEIPLGKAIQIIREMLPEPISQEQMDGYLESQFRIYNGVTDFMEWCLSKNILFMINTTGVVGYFQRIIAKKLIPPIRFLSAHPSVSYGKRRGDPAHIMALFEVQDKGLNTHKAVRSMKNPLQKIILMGDSGGDGPHFSWGADNDAFLIGSMTKASLKTYCREKGLQMDLQFGISYNAGEEKRLKDEMGVDFRELIPVVSEFAGVG
jgi:2-hydroxy-3-keto-5-methylthiopentenyl-1-phosphate phosphatase